MKFILDKQSSFSGILADTVLENCLHFCEDWAVAGTEVIKKAGSCPLM